MRRLGAALDQGTLSLLTGDPSRGAVATAPGRVLAGRPARTWLRPDLAASFPAG
ncbi:hypothetical protein ACIGXF_14330 [Streptomyces sp. NPDC053086]|uniref:hypothetical protein n=1 Tax=unclassified Streptomyces TaxID=2593676 RepID=UPI0036F734E4